MKRVAVIGGGASGMMAAIAAAENGAKVTIYEKNDRVGKKILATGNGKCNFSNRDFFVEYYYGNTEKLSGFFSQFSVEDTVSFFEQAGMLIKDKKGYLYPLSEQASTVLDILRLELQRLGIEIRLSAEIKKLTAKGSCGEGIFVHSAAGKECYDAAILTCGGCAAPKTGSDGSGYDLAESLGHHIVATVPALVQLRCSDDFFKITAGVRCEAVLKLYNGKEFVQEERGELQFTDYGISGIPVFQFSRQAAYLLKEKKKPVVYIDLLPDIEKPDWERICSDRIKLAGNKTAEEFLVGIANKKINLLMIKQAGLNPSQKVKQIGIKSIKQLLYSYKELCVHVAAANAFENAQVAAGGVDMKEVKDTLESVKMPGLYLAGEVLDVDGRCGGYNLQWAWTSGYIAGRNAGTGLTGKR